MKQNDDMPNHEDIVIRDVEPGDEKVLAYIQTESWKAAFKDILSPEDLACYADVDKAEQMYKHLLEEQIANGRILFVGGKPYCIAYWDKSREEAMMGYAELICIHSLQEQWHKGYGTRMMNYVLNEVRKQGYRNIHLWVFADNVRARKFYESIGFGATAITKETLGACEIMYSLENL